MGRDALRLCTRATVLGAGVLLAPLPGLVQGDEAAPYALGEIVVTGRAPAVEVVSTVREIDAQAMARAGARTLDDALRLLPGVNVRVANQGTPRIDVRGFRTRHVKLLINGVPFNGAADGQFDPTLIPVDQIDRIKLSTGATSVLYGDGGLGAVINIVTRGAPAGTHGAAAADFSTGSAHRYRIEFSQGGDRGGLFATVSRDARGDFPLSGDFDPTRIENSGLRDNSDLRRDNLYLSALYSPNAQWQLGLTLTAFDGAHGIPANVIDTVTDPVFGRVTRYERVPDERGWYAQANAAYAPDGPWSGSAWGYFSRLETRTVRYSDARYADSDLADETLRGTLRNTSVSEIAGGHVEASYAHPFGGSVTVVMEARQERLIQECTARDVPRALAPAPQAAPPGPVQEATLDFTYTTTNMAGATRADGSNAPVARLRMSDRAGGGIDFALESLAPTVYGVGSYLSRLYLPTTPGLDLSTWGFANAAGSGATLGGVTFGGTTFNLDAYLYPIEVRFQRPGGAGGAADPLLEGETARFFFTAGRVADLVTAPVVRSAGSGPDMLAGLRIRGTDATGFWGVSGSDLTGQGNVNAVDVQSPQVATAPDSTQDQALDPENFQAVNCSGGGAGDGSGGGDGEGDGSRVGRVPGVLFGLRDFARDRRIAVVSTAIEIGATPWVDWTLSAGVGGYGFLREGAATDVHSSFNVGAAYDVAPATRVRASLARKVRFPSVVQLFEDGFGNTGLQPERALTVEIGIEHDIPGAVDLAATAFRSDVRDLITRNDFTGRNENRNRVTMHGVEATADLVRWRRFTAGLGYTWTRTHDLSSGPGRDEIQYVPEHKVTLTSGYALTQHLRADATAEYVTGQIFYSRTAPVRKRELRPSVVLGLRLQFQAYADSVKLHLGADNLADADYEQSYGVPQAGRVVYGGVEFAF